MEKGISMKMKASYKLLRKKFGFRYLMDVIPLDSTLVKGSHGSSFVSKEYFPLLISKQALSKSKIEAPEVYQVIWQHLFDN